MFLFSYNPKVRFPKRLVKVKVEAHFLKFMTKLYVNVPFTKVLTQIPNYTKFLKQIVSKNKKLEEHKVIVMNVMSSAIIQNMPPKLDPGSF